MTRVPRHHWTMSFTDEAGNLVTRGSLQMGSLDLDIDSIRQRVPMIVDDGRRWPMMAHDGSLNGVTY